MIRNMTEPTDAAPQPAPFLPPPGGRLVDIAGLRVGHHDDPRRPTGCTVVLCPPGTVGGVDVRGAAPGTRETELLSPFNSVREVHAVLLAGGSAFGLDAAGGVMRWLEAQGIGIPVGPARVPIVPAAILFDLGLGDHHLRPDADAGHAACVAAHDDDASEGNVGAGCGATVGKLLGADRTMRGGLGQASLSLNGTTVAALVVVNAVGDVIDPRNGRMLAGARSEDGLQMVGCRPALLAGQPWAGLVTGSATTLAIVATDAALDKAQAGKLAQMAHDGLARSIDPVHTPSDGDTVFALATGGRPGTVDSATLGHLGALAAEVCARAVVRAVWAATALDRPGCPRLPCARDLAAAASVPRVG